MNADSPESTEESLSDDSNLSSTSLLPSLVEQSSTDVSSFVGLSFEDKFTKVRESTKSSYFIERDSLLNPTYDKDIEEFMERTANDRKMTFQEATIPTYLHKAMRKRTSSWPNYEDFRIPLMTAYGMGKPGEFQPLPKKKISGYVGQLITYADTLPERRATIHLMRYKKKINNEMSNKDKANESNIEGRYTKEQKEMIEEVLGDIPHRKESVFVPYDRLNILGGLEESETSSSGNISPPYFQAHQDQFIDGYYKPPEVPEYKQEVYPTTKDVADRRCSMWERMISEPGMSSTPNNNNEKSEENL